MHIKKHFHRLLLITIGIFANGCSTVPTNIQKQTNNTYNADQISRIGHWQAKGKLGFKSPDGGGSASLIWLQANENYHITLRGPFLAGTAVISGDHHMAALQQGDALKGDTFATNSFTHILCMYFTIYYFKDKAQFFNNCFKIISHLKYEFNIIGC